MTRGTRRPGPLQSPEGSVASAAVPVGPGSRPAANDRNTPMTRTDTTLDPEASTSEQRRAPVEARR
jgi:hypothetical protein